MGICGTRPRSDATTSAAAVLGASTIASTSRCAMARSRAAGVRHPTTRAPVLGSVRRSAAIALRLSSMAATAGISGRRTERRQADRLVGVVGREDDPGAGRAVGPSLPHCDQGPDHLTGALEDPPRIVVAQHLQRLLEHAPPAGGDPLVELRGGVAVGRLEEEEVAVLVDVPAAEAEMPVDDADRPLQDQPLESRLLRGLAERGLGRRLGLLEVALRKAPVVVRIANQQKARELFRRTPEDDPAGAHLELGTTLAHQKTETLMYFLGCAWMSAISSRNWRMVAAVS